MKKTLTILMAATAVALTSCKNEVDDYFGESAAERLNNTQAKYSALLASVQYGWAFEYYPTGSASGGAVLYSMKFYLDGSVDVAGDPWNDGVVTNEVSCWDIIADNGPTLSFSTYNWLIHQFADPVDDGLGYEGDYEFSLVHSDTENPDSVVMLKGKKRGIYHRLKMIDEDVTPAQYLNGITAFFKATFPEKAPNYLLLHMPDSLVRIDEMGTTTPKAYRFGGDPVYAVSCPFITTKYDGIYRMRFGQPFKSPAGDEYKTFVFDDERQLLWAENDPSVQITGPVTNDFLYDRLVAGASFRLTVGTDMSDDLKKAITDLRDDLSRVKCTFTNITLKRNADGDMMMTLTYRNSKKQEVKTNYLYLMTQGDNGNIRLQYVKAEKTAGENLFTTIPALQPALKALEGNYEVLPAKSPLNLTTVTFNDGGKQFTVDPTYPQSQESEIQ